MNMSGPQVCHLIQRHLSGHKTTWGFDIFNNVFYTELIK